MKQIIDASVFCGCWPFRPTALRSPGDLKAHLEPKGVRRAWVSPAEAILAPDPMQANEPLFSAVDGDEFFVPVGAVNPALATWKRDAEACIEHRGARALKLFPSYHGYELSDPRVDELSELAREAGAPVCIQAAMMDQRSQHPLVVVEPLPAAEIVSLAGRHPEARFLACGVFASDLKKLGEAPNVWAEISLVESEQALRNAVEAMGPERVVFGSHSPFQYFEAMLAKLDVAAEDVAPGVVDAVCESNAAELLRG